MQQPSSTPVLFERAVRAGDLLFVSGQLPIDDEGVRHPGFVGRNVTVAQAREEAALAARRCLEVAAAELGPLDAIKGVVQIVGDGFTAAPGVAEAASQVALDELGDRGRHARPVSQRATFACHAPGVATGRTLPVGALALGVAPLLLGTCVEIETAVQC